MRKPFRVTIEKTLKAHEVAYKGNKRRRYLIYAEDRQEAISFARRDLQPGWLLVSVIPDFMCAG